VLLIPNFINFSMMEEEPFVIGAPVLRRCQVSEGIKDEGRQLLTVCSIRRTPPEQP
jgi:hypothetical protein